MQVTLHIGFCTCTGFVFQVYILLIRQINSLQIKDGPNPAEEDLTPAKGNITLHLFIEILISLFSKKE